MNTDTSGSIELPVRLDSLAAKTLMAEVLALRGQPLTVKAGDVEFVGALGLQALVAAARQWGIDGQTFDIAPTSEGLSRACAMLGVSPADIGAKTQEEAAT